MRTPLFICAAPFTTCWVDSHLHLTPDGDITPALEFATSQLAPRAPTNPQFLEDLERTLALLIFPSENLAPSLASLLHPDLRMDIATRVNEAILQSQGARKEPDTEPGQATRCRNKSTRGKKRHTREVGSGFSAWQKREWQWPQSERESKWQLRWCCNG